MRVVIVEDSVSLAKGIAYRLRDEGHAVDLVHDGAEADAFLAAQGADMVLLDLNLPGMGGLEVLAALRARGDAVPVLLLTARAGPGDVVAGLDAGADDYLVKPFEMSELAARMRALSRRAEARPVTERHLGPLVFDPAARTLRAGARPLDLPRRETALFEALLAAAGRPVTKQALLDALYGTGEPAREEVVEVYVSRLRKRLRPHGVEIVARRGIGYEMREAP